MKLLKWLTSSNILSVVKYMLLSGFIVICLLTVLLLKVKYIPLPPINEQTYTQLDAHTTHSFVFPIQQFIPKNRDLNTWFICPKYDQIPILGGHCFNPIRWLTASDKPAGYVIFKGKIVALFYSMYSPGHYHAHFHADLCLAQGAVPRTDLSFWQCLKHGYFPMPLGKWMVHYWLIPNPDGLNEMYNPLLK